MSEKKKEYIVTGYDTAREAYIIELYTNGVFTCSYTAWLNHRTHTFRCYPRALSKCAPLSGVVSIHETEVKKQLTG